MDHENPCLTSYSLVFTLTMSSIVFATDHLVFAYFVSPISNLPDLWLLIAFSTWCLCLCISSWVSSDSDELKIVACRNSRYIHWEWKLVCIRGQESLECVFQSLLQSEGPSNISLSPKAEMHPCYVWLGFFFNGGKIPLLQHVILKEKEAISVCKAISSPTEYIALFIESINISLRAAHKGKNCKGTKAS